MFIYIQLKNGLIDVELFKLYNLFTSTTNYIGRYKLMYISELVLHLVCIHSNTLKAVFMLYLPIAHSIIRYQPLLVGK